MSVFVLVCITLCPFQFCKIELIALLLLSYRCLATVYAVWLFLTMPWIDLQCVIVVFPDHTHLLFYLFIFIVYASNIRFGENVQTQRFSET